MNGRETRGRLLELLTELSYESRNVVLASGRTSNFYIDCRNTALHPEGNVLCGKMLLERIRSVQNVHGVAGPSIGADPLVCAVAHQSFLSGGGLVPGIFVRKEAKGHGTGRRLEGTRNVPEGGRLVLVEDVFTTGGSALRTISAIRQEGYEIAAVFALVDRMEGGLERVRDESGVSRVEALFCRTDFPGAGE